MRLLWEAWKAYAHRAGSMQSRVLLNLAYFIVFGPSALLARAFGAQLLDAGQARVGESYWRAREPAPSTLEGLERQF